MSLLAKYLCGMYFVTSSILGPPVSYCHNINNVTSNEVTSIVHVAKAGDLSTVLLTTREAKGLSELPHDVILKSVFGTSIQLPKPEIKVLKKHGQVVGVSGSNLCIRKEPNTNAEILYGIYNGETFDIESKTDSWYKIKHCATTGYVHEKFVEEFDKNPPHPVYVKPKAQEVAIPQGRAIKAELTAYCNCSECSSSWDGITSSGTHTRLGVIAVPKNIPLGSNLYIPALTKYKADGIFHAEDRGGAIVVKADNTYVIDVWLPSHQQTQNFGRQKTTIYLMD